MKYSAQGGAGTTSDRQSGTEDRAKSNGHDPTVLETARTLFARGIMPLPVEEGSKNPNRLNWQDERYYSANVERDFGKRKGLGARWGRILGANGQVLTDNKVDVDLDVPEAIRAAPFYLPDTGMRWGRPSKPNSHWVYAVPTVDVKIQTVWTDPTTKDAAGKHHRLLEIRKSGHSVAPGSVNTASGRPELVRWEPGMDGEPAHVTLETLAHACRHIGAASLCARLWREGDRHDTALPLAGFLFYGGMSEDDAETFFRAVCAAARDEQVDDRLAALADTYRKGRAGEPVTGGQTLEERFSARAVAYLRKWLRLKAKAYLGVLGPDLLPLSGDGDGERFAAMWAEDVRYCMAEDAWYIRDDTRFRLDEVGEINERAKQTVRMFRRVLGEKVDLCGHDGVASYAECANYSKKMGSDANIAAMLRSARTKEEVRVTPEQLNADPLLFNTLDVTLELDIETGQIREHLHDPGDQITWLAPVHYRPGATHPLFTQYLRRFFPERERRRALGEEVAMALHGLPKRHALSLIGPHDAGKSTTLNVWRAVWGDYAASLDPESLRDNPHKGGDVPRSDLWRVRKKRLVTAADMPADIRFDVALFKILLGGGDARALRTLWDKSGGKDVVFTFSLWMSGNKPYGPPPDEEAAYDRLDVLACDHVVPEAARDAVEEQALTVEQGVLDAAFAFAVKAFHRLYGRQRGVLSRPASSQKAKEKLVDDLDEWTDVIALLFEFTGSPEDGVLKSGAWGYVRSERDIQRNSYKLQASFESSLIRRGAAEAHSSSRFEGAHYWKGVKWSPYAMAHYRV
jgi:D5 N terminal like/Bifunctional DNA primase/polymerase, N-terminal